MSSECRPSDPATQFQQEHQTALATSRLTTRTMFDPPLNLEPDPSTIRPSRAATRIIKRLPLAPVSTIARRDSWRSRRSSTDEGPVAGPSRLPILAAPASGVGMSKHVFDRLVEGDIHQTDTQPAGSTSKRLLQAHSETNEPNVLETLTREPCSQYDG
jgi:hypothetical protein